MLEDSKVAARIPMQDLQRAKAFCVWRAWGDDVQGYALDAGHFFPEEAPEQTADALNRFFGASESSHL
jgi:pimeloyl-ACP methyl ester carboxylesterase